jgi:hypothetical protein
MKRILEEDYLALLATCFYADLFLGLFFGLEAGGDMFLRNIG